ncbi:hypothetical protein V5O48_015711 [Marasmius crinis-equi]|uniref:Uncharacterized protein n=1 Tax=Marasmius crinis-equi TaxID=585013 RepID=A0ABR3EU33_9AGAR
MNSIPQTDVDDAGAKSKFLEEYTRQPTEEEIMRWHAEVREKPEELADTTTYECLLRLYASGRETKDTEFTSLLARVYGVSEPADPSSSSSASKQRSSQPPPPNVQPSNSATTTTCTPETFSSASASTTAVEDVGVSTQRVEKPYCPRNQAQPRTIPKKRPPGKEERTRKLESQLQEATKLTGDTQTMLEDVRAQLEAMKIDRDQYKAKLDDEITRNTELYQQLEGSRREKGDIRRSNTRLEEQVKALEVDIRKLRGCEGKVTELEALVERQREELRRTTKRLEDAQKVTSSELETSIRERELAKVELEKCKRERDMMKAGLERESAEHQEIRRQWDAGSKAVRDAIAIYQADASKWGKERKTLDTANKDQEATIRELQERAKVHRDENTRLERSIEALKGENEHIRESQNELQKKVVTSEADVKKLSEQLELRETELTMAKAAVTAEHEIVEQSDHATQRLQAKMDEQNSRLDVIHAKTEQLALRFANVRNSYAEEKVSKEEILAMCDRLGPWLVCVSEMVAATKRLENSVSTKSTEPTERLSQIASGSKPSSSSTPPVTSATASATPSSDLTSSTSTQKPCAPQTGAPSTSSKFTASVSVRDSAEPVPLTGLARRPPAPSLSSSKLIPSTAASEASIAPFPSTEIASRPSPSSSPPSNPIPTPGPRADASRISVPDSSDVPDEPDSQRKREGQGKSTTKGTQSARLVFASSRGGDVPGSPLPRSKLTMKVKKPPVSRLASNDYDEPEPECIYFSLASGERSRKRRRVEEDSPVRRKLGGIR